MELEQSWEEVETHNAKILRTVKSTGDDKLDTASWSKTLKEFECGSLMGPFRSMEELPIWDVRLLKRVPIWEAHGGGL